MGYIIKEDAMVASTAVHLAGVRDVINIILNQVDEIHSNPEYENAVNREEIAAGKYE